MLAWTLMGSRTLAEARDGMGTPGGTLTRTLGGTRGVSRVLCRMLTGTLMVSRTLREGPAVSWTLAGTSWTLSGTTLAGSAAFCTVSGGAADARATTAVAST